ncbi:MAG: hypothetical protein JXB32_26255, partial [Deltaproteobacteria bacterium]|nr:hypothetical protein [Deltaproteobacteria bacterium]
APPDFDEIVPDPCLAGEMAVPARTVSVAHEPQFASSRTGWAPGDGVAGRFGLPPSPSGPDWQDPAMELVEFDVPADGAVCIVVRNGSVESATRAATGRVWLDDEEIIGGDRFEARHTLVRHRARVSAGRHKVVIHATAGGDATPGAVKSSGPVASYTYYVRFQAGDALPRPVPEGKEALAGTAGAGQVALSNLALAADGNVVHAKVELDATVGAYVHPGLTHAARYVMQVADARTCRQVAELARVDVLRAESLGGLEEAIATAGVAWQPEAGRVPRRVYVRVAAVVDVPGAPVWGWDEPSEQQPRPVAIQLPLEVSGPALAAPVLSAPVALDVRQGVPKHLEGIVAAEDGTMAFAPQARWRSHTLGEFYAMRKMSLRGDFPATPSAGSLCTPFGWCSETCLAYRVLHVQLSPYREWWGPAGCGGGWGLTVLAPSIGNAFLRPPSPPSSEVGDAQLLVYHPRGIGAFGRPQPYTIRAPRFDEVIDPSTGMTPAEFRPGAEVRLRGSLFKTYYVLFEVRQGGRTWNIQREGGGAPLLWEWENADGHLGDAEVAFRMPHDLAVGVEACVRVKSGGYWGENRPVGEIGMEEFCARVLPPEVRGVRPGCGRWHDTVTLFGWRLAASGVGEPIVKFVQFPGGAGSEWTADVREVRDGMSDIDGDMVPDADVNGDTIADGDSEIEVEVPFGCPDGVAECTSARKGPMIGQNEIRVYYEDPPWGGEGAVEIPGRVDFWVKGRENGNFRFLTGDFPDSGEGVGALNLSGAYDCWGTGGDACQAKAWMPPPFGEVNYTCSDRQGTATIKITSVETDPGSPHFGRRWYTVRVEGGSTHTGSFYISPGGWGGLALSPECTVLMRLSWIPGTTDDFTWEARYAGPYMSDGDHGGSRWTHTITPGGSWAFVLAGFSPDETVEILGYPRFSSGAWKFQWNLEDFGGAASYGFGAPPRSLTTFPLWSARMEENRAWDFRWGSGSSNLLASESGEMNESGDPALPGAPESCDHAMAP